MAIAFLISYAVSDFCRTCNTLYVFISGIGMNVILCDSLHTDICICGLFFESCNEILLCKQNSL